MADNSSLFRLLWPEIDDADSAKAASRLGVFGAALFSVGSAALVTYGLIRMHGAVSSANASAYLGAVIFAVLAFGIFKLWRSAAIAALLLFLAVQVLAGLRAHGMVGFVMPIVLALFMSSGVRGTVLFHKFSRPEAPGGDA
jgi:O-antigen ligase